MKSNRHAFTLVEIMVVLAIVAVLTLVSTFGILPQWRKSKITTDLQQASALRAPIIAVYNSLTLTTPLPITAGAEVAQSSVSGLDTGEVAEVANIGDVLTLYRMIDQPPRWETGRRDARASSAGVAFSPTLNAWTGTGTILNSGSLAPTVECRLSNPALVPSASDGANFRLDGLTNLNSNLRVFYVRIPAVTASYAYLFATLALPSNSPLLPADNTLASDSGKVVYAAPVDGLTDVYLFIEAR